MNSLSLKAEITMSSLEIADLCRKQHFHVMRDIRELLGEAASKFGGNYVGRNGAKSPCYWLPFRESMIVVSGYNTEIRTKIIDRWLELEQTAKTPSTVGNTLNELRDELDRRDEKLLEAVDDRMGRYATRRKDPSKATKGRLMLVFHTRGSRCPCCEKEVSDDQINIDHWYDNSSAEVAALWPICIPCHKEFKHDAEYRHDRRSRFDAFHEFRKTLPGEQLKLI